MAWPQKEMSRPVSQTSKPCIDLNHWRDSSIREIATIGMSKTWATNRVRLSKTASGSESRSSRENKASKRSRSSPGIFGASIVCAPAKLPPALTLNYYSKINRVEKLI